LTDCTTEADGTPGDDDYKPAQAGADGMQIFEKVYSMRYRQKLFPVSVHAGASVFVLRDIDSGSRPMSCRVQCPCCSLIAGLTRGGAFATCQIQPLECVTRYDLELAVEYDAEVSRARGYEVVLPSADMKNYHQFMKSNRYADMLLQRLLQTPRTTNYTTHTVSRQALADARSAGRGATGGEELPMDSEKRGAKSRRKQKQKQKQKKLQAEEAAAASASEAAKAEL
jgi:hypothetical protein